MQAISVTLGVSLAITGTPQTLRTPATTASHLPDRCRNHSAADIGAGNVQFQGMKPGQAVEPGRHVDKLLLALARQCLR